MRVYHYSVRTSKDISFKHGSRQYSYGRATPATASAGATTCLLMRVSSLNTQAVVNTVRVAASTGKMMVTSVHLMKDMTEKALQDMCGDNMPAWIAGNGGCEFATNNEIFNMPPKSHAVSHVPLSSPHTVTASCNIMLTKHVQFTLSNVIVVSGCAFDDTSKYIVTLDWSELGR